ncbi:hypothetical protein BDV29DRAFT_57176 [Aspergillus leporis]|uniref:Uncharacterized protein n=1 Tax=Aspergillus leporis TaxID=41062 RepID=A0A5N5WN29_9EURO|nr:hypothetical protein BDV29DRAFT_57176 [Aspergillus leporis]
MDPAHILDAIQDISFNLRDDDENKLRACKAKFSDIATQLAVLERIEPIARLIRRGQSLPMRSLNPNIKSLSDAHKADELEVSRWVRIRNLDLAPAIFCMTAYSGLSYAPAADFEWLLTNVQRYMDTQELPENWIFSKQITGVMARVIRRPSTISFIEKYNRHQAESGASQQSAPPTKHICRKRDHQTSGKSESEQETNGNVPSGCQPLKSLAKEPLRGCHETVQGTSIENQRHSSNPLTGGREMKYMFSNAPVSHISVLPELLRTAVENSRLWKWERSQNLNTTGCLASLFPKDLTQDVSFTIWCGCDDGYYLNTVFGLQREIAS